MFHGSRAPVGLLLDRQSVYLLGDNLTTPVLAIDAGVASPQDVFEVYKEDDPTKLLNGGVEYYAVFCVQLSVPGQLQTSFLRDRTLDLAQLDPILESGGQL